jgi:hypothetical protein
MLPLFRKAGGGEKRRHLVSWYVSFLCSMHSENRCTHRHAKNLVAKSTRKGLRPRGRDVEVYNDVQLRDGFGHLEAHERVAIDLPTPRWRRQAHDPRAQLDLPSSSRSKSTTGTTAGSDRLI